MFQPKKWWIGLPVLAGLVYVATEPLTHTIEFDLARRVGARLARTGGAIDNPRIETTGRDVRALGVALSQDAKNKAISDAGQEAGVRAFIDATKAVGVVMPFILTIERKGAEATLGGNIPVSGERSKLRALLASAGLNVVDNTGYATGAPPGFLELALFAAQRAAELSAGGVTLTGNVLSIEGEAKSGADYDKFVAAMKAPPPNARASSVKISPPRISPYVRSAATANGLIALSGAIPTNELRAEMVAKAAANGAGAAVSDSTQIGAGAPTGDFGATIGFALAELGKLARGKVAIEDAKLSIEGEGRDNVGAATLRADAKAGLPRGFELAKVDVAPGPVSPYVFSATKTGTALVFSGHVPDADAHGKIVEAARRRFPGAAIADETTLAKGAPKQFAEAVAAAFPQLARLANGKLTLSGAEASLRGEALYEKAHADIERRLAAALPRGFSGVARLSARTTGSSLDAGLCRSAIAEVVSKGRIVFGEGDATIADESAPLLDTLAVVVLRCQNFAIEVGGHTDSFGMEEINREVTKRRAQAVVDWLARAGADPFRLTAVGHGGERPLAPNDSADNRAKNRRIDVTVK